jgi:hypothetical protein
VTIMEVHILPRYAKTKIHPTRFFLTRSQQSRVPPKLIEPDKAAPSEGHPKQHNSFPANIMTTRRYITNDKSGLGQDDKDDFKPVPGEKSNIAPAVPAYVLQIRSHEVGSY